jgi:hypothetical protein
MKYVGVCIVSLFLLLALVPMGSAVSEVQITNGWFSYADSISAGGNTYSIQGANTAFGSEGQTFVVIKKNDLTGVHVNLEDCKTTDDYKYCFEEIDFEGEQIDIDAEGRLQPALRITITEFRYGTSAKAYRTFEETRLFWGQETEVTVSVENTGDGAIEGQIIEKVPEGYTILNADSTFTQFGDNSLRANFVLFPEGIWEKTYTVRADTYESAPYQTVVNYASTEDENEEKVTYSNQVTLSVITPYEVSDVLSRSVLDIKERQEFTVTITNTDNDDILLKELIITAPENLDAVSVQNLQNLGNNKYGISPMTLIPEESITFEYSGRAPFAGTYALAYEGIIEKQGNEYEFGEEKTFTVSTDGIYCEIESPDDSFSALTPFEVSVRIGNNDNEAFQAISGNTSTGQEITVESITTGSELEYFNEVITPPFSLEQTSYTYNFSGTYVSNVGQVFDIFCEQVFSIQPASQLFTMEGISTTETTARNDTVTFTVQFTDIQTDLSQVILAVKDQERAISLQSGTAHEEIFTIPVPEYYDEETFVVDILATSNNYEETTSVSYTVTNPYDFEADFEAQFGEDEEVEEESEEPSVVVRKKGDDAEKSFIDQVLDLIRSIFN